MIHLLPIEVLQNVAGRKNYLLCPFNFPRLNGHAISVLSVWFEIGIISVEQVSSKCLIVVCKE